VRKWLVIGVAAAAAVFAAALLTRSVGKARPTTTGPAATASTAVSPAFPSFADRVTADVSVLVDPRRVDPHSVRVDARFTPYRALGSPQRSESASGSSTLVRYRYIIDCLVRECLPRNPFVFPRARVRYRGQEAGELTAVWPQVLVVPRVQAEDLKLKQMRDGLRPLPRPSYRVSPVGLELALGGAAVLLVLGAGGLVIRTRPRRAPASVPETNGALSPLETALVLVRQAASRDDAVMQRKALERLASELRRAGLPGLARSARRLAWSQREPRARSTNALADEVVRAEGIHD
jgi:hypothetical protein